MKFVRCDFFLPHTAITQCCIETTFFHSIVLTEVNVMPSNWRSDACQIDKQCFGNTENGQNKLPMEEIGYVTPSLRTYPTNKNFNGI